MDDTEDVKEKRRHNRKSVKITALLKMGVYLSGRGFAKDISESGMCIVAPNMFKFMKPQQTQEYIGTHLRVMFPSPSLTVNGVVVRIDTKTGEGALSITNTSDDALWLKMCSE